MTKDSSLPSPSPSQANRAVDKRSAGLGLDGFSCWIYAAVALAMLAQAGWVLWVEYY